MGGGREGRMGEPGEKERLAALEEQFQIAMVSTGWCGVIVFLFLPHFFSPPIACFAIQFSAYFDDYAVTWFLILLSNVSSFSTSPPLCPTPLPLHW